MLVTASAKLLKNGGENQTIKFQQKGGFGRLFFCWLQVFIIRANDKKVSLCAGYKFTLSCQSPFFYWLFVQNFTL